LISQLEKCGVSIPSNIAKGSGKRTSPHFAEFLTTSLTSAYEAETQPLICKKRNYGSEKEILDLLNKAEELQKKIYNFRETITKSK
jgi:four helix bundle protein